MQKIYIIIVNYHGGADTLECLESLLKSSYENFQVFVADNSGKNDDFEQFRLWSKNIPSIAFFTEKEFNGLPSSLSQKIIFIKAEKNNGFAAANNITLKYLQKQSDFVYLWLLNNDTVVPADFLEKILEKLKTTGEKYGIFGNALCYYDNPQILQCAGIRCSKWLAHTFPVYENTEYAQVFSLLKDKPLHGLSPVGASMFIKKECFEDVGLLAEDYFLYFEEWDYTIRAEKKNWKSLIFGDVFIYHKFAMSIDKGNKKGADKTLFSDYYLTKNKKVFANKNLKYYYLPTVYLSYIPIILNRIKRRQWSRVVMVVRIILGLKANLNEK